MSKRRARRRIEDFRPDILDPYYVDFDDRDGWASADGPPADPYYEAVMDSRQRAGMSALVNMAMPVAVPNRGMPALESVRPARPVRPRRGARLAAVLPLLAVLAAQGLLADRLLWSNTAFQDEALYLWAGHLEIAHWLHGAVIPPFATYFSGAPVLYPPLAAAADNLGGLAAARLLSMACMLATTAFLWSTTARLYGRRAAFFAAALFALLGPTLHLSAFATFDALSMLLIAAATWCVVRADGGEATGWMLSSAALLTLANATAYSSAIFDPVVITLAILTGVRVPGKKQLARRSAAISIYVVALIVILAEIGGGYYWTGIGETVLMRSAGQNSPMLVLQEASAWTLVVAIPAAVGALIAPFRRQRAGLRLIPLVLLGAALLAPVEQARIRTTVSLDKHTDVGAWFAAIAAGFAIDACIRWLRSRQVRIGLTAAGLAALAIPAQIGIAQADSLYSWPNAAAFVNVFGRLAGSSGRLLVEDPSVGEYYLRAGTQWQRWSNTHSIVLPSGRGTSGTVGRAGSAAEYATFIARGYFALIALNFQATPALDHAIAADLARDPDYRVVATVPYGGGDYILWQHQHAGARQ